MSDESVINYGPLTDLIGVWSGDNGRDVAPEPDGAETNPYFETITFTAIGDVTNAESQVLSALHYRQIVQRKSDNEIFHDETGYWMWDSKTDIVIHSLVIPRGVCVLAGGKHSDTNNNSTTLEVSAKVDDQDWHIIQSPFMRDNARTTEFHHTMTVDSEKLTYTETIMLDIYGKVFEHTDSNNLTRQ